ncbi:MAG: SpoIIE family protein phosphatase [Anaerolineae bacterium]
MLGLKDFIHLPQVDPLFEQIARSEPGVVVVAGLEPRPLVTQARELTFQPSGRATIFGILFRQMLAARRGRIVVIAESQDAIRLPRGLRGQVEYILTTEQAPVALQVERAVYRGAGLLVVDRLTPATAPIAFNAARKGVRVLAQLDSVFRGHAVALQLSETGLSPVDLMGLNWVVAVSRFPVLCPSCRQSDPLDRPALEEIRRRYPAALDRGNFFREGNCPECHHTGRKGEVSTFDIFHLTGTRTNPLDGESLLALEDYVLGLAAQGMIPIDDVLAIDGRQLQRTYHLLTASEEVLAETNAALNAKVAEIEAANRVLIRQTEAAISLQEVSHALITYTDLEGLASYVCRKAGELCGADRAILYLLHSDDRAEILAVNGWDPAHVQGPLQSTEVLNAGGAPETWANAEPKPFAGWPPGIEHRAADIEGARLRAGLRVPLVTQNEVVGLLIFHSTVKPAWQPREVALLRSFANSSALAIQRAGLVESLRDKIERLEAAHAEIAKKERLERELELARQVQQSMLPHIFPMVPGLSFAARSEPARQVGGDFYDVFLLDGTRCGVVIADVSDKGMPAALFMALTRSLLLAEARRESSPATVLQRVHRLLLELSQSDQFVTVFYGVIDSLTRSLTYVRAGHERPLLLRAGEIHTLQGHGMVLGGLDLDQLSLSEERITLESGDRLVLFTDGMLDALSDRGQFFGLERLMELFQTSALPLQEMCDAAFIRLKAYQGNHEQYDDMTLLAVEVH